MQWSDIITQLLHCSCFPLVTKINIELQLNILTHKLLFVPVLCWSKLDNFVELTKQNHFPSTGTNK